MNKKSPNITILAYTITSHGGGLELFLIKAVDELTRIKPDWNFNLIWFSSFSGAFQKKPANLHFQNWDNQPVQRVGVTFLNKVLPGFIRLQVSKLILHRMDRIRNNFHKPSEAILQTIQNSDALWVPFYNTSLANLSLFQDLREITKPILYTIHDIQPVFYPNDWPADSLGRFWLEMVPFAQRSQLIITHTGFQRDCIIQNLQLEPEKVAVALIPPLIEPNFLQQSFTAHQEETILSEYSIHRPYALYPGSTTGSHKNHARLLIAWAELRKRLGPACPMLVCTAKGLRWNELKSLIEALQLQDIVRFTDTIDPTRLALLIQQSVLVVVPTLYEGGGSGPVTDAILTGRPVLCSQIAPIEEQLNYIGYQDPQFFDPLSVLSITQAVQDALHHLPELELKARLNQQRVLARLSLGWSEWSLQYIQGFENIMQISL